MIGGGRIRKLGLGVWDFGALGGADATVLRYGRFCRGWSAFIPPSIFLSSTSHHRTLISHPPGPWQAVQAFRARAVCIDLQTVPAHLPGHRYSVPLPWLALVTSKVTKHAACHAPSQLPPEAILVFSAKASIVLKRRLNCAHEMLGSRLEIKSYKRLFTPPSFPSRLPSPGRCTFLLSVATLVFASSPLSVFPTDLSPRPSMEIGLSVSLSYSALR